MASIEELAWAGGLFEGEGCFVCYKLSHRKDSYRVSTTLSMTDKDVVETFCKVMGFGTVKGPYSPSNGNKLRYVWEVQNFRDCLKVTELLYPYLHSRRKQKADELIKLCKTRLGE